MKTLIDIDDALLEKAMKLSCAETKKEMIHWAMEALIKLKLRGRLKQMAGSGATEWHLSGLKASRYKREKAQIQAMKNGPRV